MSYFQMEYYRLESENKKLKARIAELENQLAKIKPQKTLKEQQIEKELEDYDRRMRRIQEELGGVVYVDKDENGSYLYIELETETDWEEVFRIYFDKYEIKTYGFEFAEDESLLEKMKGAYDDFIYGKFFGISFEDFLEYSEREAVWHG